MKRFITILLALALVLSLAACGNGSAGNSNANIEGSVEELIGKVIDGAVDPEMALMTVEANEDNFEWYFFIPPVEGAEAWISEPMIGSIPHFVGMIRVPAGTDPATVKSDIEKNLDPRKWVCVEAEKSSVVARGDLILVVMSDSATVDNVVANFNAL